MLTAVHLGCTLSIADVRACVCGVWSVACPRGGGRGGTRAPPCVDPTWLVCSRPDSDYYHTHVCMGKRVHVCKNIWKESNERDRDRTVY